jgi:hypothetical protein
MDNNSILYIIVIGIGLLYIMSGNIEKFSGKTKPVVKRQNLKKPVVKKTIDKTPNTEKKPRPSFECYNPFIRTNPQDCIALADPNDETNSELEHKPEYKPAIESQKKPALTKKIAGPVDKTSVKEVARPVSRPVSRPLDKTGGTEMTRQVTKPGNKNQSAHNQVLSGTRQRSGKTLDSVGEEFMDYNPLENKLVQNAYHF